MRIDQSVATDLATIDQVVSRGGFRFDDVVRGRVAEMRPTVESNQTHVQVFGGSTAHVGKQLQRWDTHLSSRPNYREIAREVRPAADGAVHVTIVYRMTSLVDAMRSHHGKRVLPGGASIVRTPAGVR